MSTGIYKVKKNHISIFEKGGQYCGTLKEGIYFLFPLLYKKVATFKVEENKQKIKNKNINYIITYKIENYKDFYYNHNGDATEIFIKELSKNEDDLSTRLIEEYKKIHITFLKAEEIIK